MRARLRAWRSPPPAVAQVGASTAAPTPDAAHAGDDAGTDIVVTGYRYLDVDTSGITNLPLPIEKVPQSISLLNSDFVKAADVRTIADVAQYTTGGLWASYVPSYGSGLAVLLPMFGMSLLFVLTIDVALLPALPSAQKWLGRTQLPI